MKLPSVFLKLALISLFHSSERRAVAFAPSVFFSSRARSNAFSHAFSLTNTFGKTQANAILSLNVRGKGSPSHIRMSTSASSTTSSTLPDAPSMRAGELKKELESYGISTKSFFEKSELVEAVEKARAEGKVPISQTSSSASSSSSSTSSTSQESDSSSSSSTVPRKEKLLQEMENCKTMKASELKAELESYGISTKAFFEKSEFVKACAEARVDGATKKSSSSYAEYTTADIEVITDDAGPKKKQNQSPGGSNPFGGMGGMGDMGGGANPFGGGAGANPFGGMGGIADMMKNMGGVGGGANPFGGGAGANPFGSGDAMKKAQEMMSNPKVMEIMMKAQSNPKIMKAVQECMGNPMAFAKYKDDPDVGELIRELQKYM